MKFLLTTNPGIEDIVRDEVLEKVPGAAVGPFFNLQGRVMVEMAEEGLPQLFSLRSIYRVIRHVHSFRLPHGEGALEEVYREVRRLHIAEMEAARSFRVTSTRVGEHPFTSVDIQRVAGQALVDGYGRKVDLRGYDVEVIVDVIGNKGWVGVNLTHQSLHRRFERAYDHIAAIKPPLAYAMLRLASLREGHVLLDPMCGGGTIPIEAAQVFGQRVKILASDNNPRALEGAKANAKACGVEDLIEFRLLDARELHGTFSGVHRIVTNPPYGVRMGQWRTIRPLYKAFLRSAAEVLVEGGVMAIITVRATAFRDLVFKSRRYIVSHERVVEAGGLFPHIFVLERI